MGNDTLFRKSSLNSISSPEQLNDYIKVATPSVWLVLVALFVLLAAFLFWGITGSIPTTVSTKGVACDGQIVCYINTDYVTSLKDGQSASITNKSGTSCKGQITDIGDMPMSANEITSELDSEYLTYELVPDQFAVKLTITAGTSDFADGEVLDVRIVTDTVRPIDFLLGM